MAVALNPSIVTSQSEHLLEIETQSELTRGMTVVDRLNVAKDPHNRETWSAALAANHKSKILWTIDNLRWKLSLYATLK
jgi:purine nucleosidase